MINDPRPGVCQCRRSSTTVGDRDTCPECNHPKLSHDVIAAHAGGVGCVDGVDNPGSTEPQEIPGQLLQATPHGPSAEQWARGMVFEHSARLIREQCKELGVDAGSPAALKAFIFAINGHAHMILTGELPEETGKDFPCDA